MKRILLAMSLIIFSGLAASANLTVEVVDDNGDRLNSELLLTQDGQEIESSTSFLEASVNDGEEYNLTQNITSGPNVKIKNFSITQDFDFRPQMLDESPGRGGDFLINTDPLYFVNQSITFMEAEISVDRSAPDRIAKCESLNERVCSEWTVNETQDYINSVDDPIDSEDYLYIVDSFSGYTTGDIAPAPEIENISIYNVTEETDKRSGGQLVDQGLNKTFLIGQKEAGEYRFSFNVSNQGSDTWNLDSSDLLRHQGLNSTWNVSDIYYEDPVGTRDGGTFSSGEVEWNTGNGGTLDPGENLAAEYIVEIDQNKSSTFSQEFEASTTEVNDTDLHELEFLKYGDLNVSLGRPEDGTVVQNNRDFIMNGTATCVNGDCGEISFEPRRNTSSGLDSFTGEIFEVLDQNSTASCDNLLQDDLCEVEWSVNATGDPDTFHELDFQASSNYEDVENSDTLNSVVEIRDIFLMSLDWETVDFGVLDPGDRERPAENNSQGYNLTISEDSNTVDSLWVKASSLVHESNENYSIGSGNLTYAEENNYSESTEMTEDYSLFDSSIAPGTTKNLYYWLNVPYGILRGGYSGTITFKANSTAQ